ncbi:tyrosine-type recombinase/integrase [Alkaliphilus sp. MSJ-5]|uniref:Tyrosine-type recombinase/integrase n=1 Tax=Alkaliphilus flagellatus TaxID=2841507 RepID=A0ABS6G642_9FIRM|nr:tyrosine-type recombinase/integrase [Alkaliphilus flagellatus]
MYSSSTTAFNIIDIYDITIHDLRHTCGTSLIAKGIDFKTTAQLLGHDV